MDLCNKGFKHIVLKNAALSSAAFHEKQREEALQATQKLEVAMADLEKRKKQVAALREEINSLSNQIDSADDAGDIDRAIDLQRARAGARQRLNRVQAGTEPPVPTSETECAPQSKKRKQPETETEPEAETETEVEPKPLTDARPVTEEVETNRPKPKKKTKRRKTNWTKPRKK